jgi:hypothetical protein
MANFDELPLIVASIKQHSCHLTIEEEQGIKHAAKYWQKGIIKMMAVEQKWKEKMTAVEQGIKRAAKYWQKGIHLLLHLNFFLVFSSLEASYWYSFAIPHSFLVSWSSFKGEFLLAKNSCYACINAYVSAEDSSVCLLL